MAHPFAVRKQSWLQKVCEGGLEPGQRVSLLGSIIGQATGKGAGFRGPYRCQLKQTWLTSRKAPANN